MPSMRILIFSLVYYPRFVGGAEVAVKEITDRIPSEEIEFDMIALNGGGEPAMEKIGNVTVHRIFIGVNPFTKLLYPFAAFFKARSLHGHKRYDASWSIMANRAGFAALFFKWANPKVPFILTLQEGDPLDYPRRRAWFVYPLFKHIFRKADRIQAISTFLADWAGKMGAVCPISVIPNAVDIRLFSGKIPENESAALKNTLGKKEGDVFLVTTGRLVAKNATMDVIQALPLLPLNVKFLILGAGELESDLKALVLNLQLGFRVSFLGYIPHKNMPKYLQVSDIFIRPSLSEGLGNSFLEAMAAGIPVIATPVGGIPDFLTDGETGLFCEVNNPRSIVQKVQKLIKDTESRDYIIKNAREMVKRKYQWEKIAREMKEILLHPSAL